jgi:hypothetical protein
MTIGRSVASTLACILLVLPADLGWSADRVNVVAQDLLPITRAGDPSDPALLLIYVVDADGVPLKGAEISIASAPGEKLKGTTGQDGVALLRLKSATASLTVRASLKGYATSAARRVSVKANGLTAVALPLQAEE